jgi:hypothetical protein
VILLDIRGLEKMLKGTKPRVGFRCSALAGGVVQVDPAAGTQAAALGPAKRLKRQVQEHILTQEPRQVQAIVLQNFHVHLLRREFGIIAARPVRGSNVQNLELV